MPTMFRFHPKAILLSASDQATLFVGSGNLTFGGLRENAEIWTRFDTENDEGGAFSSFQDYLFSIQSHISLSDSVDNDVAEAFSAHNHNWSENLPDPSFLYGRLGNGESLLDQIRGELGGGVVDRIVVCSPYYDAAAAALIELSHVFGDPRTEVLLQDRRSTLFKEAAEKLPLHIKLKTIEYRRKKSDEKSPEKFIHAKFYAFFRGDHVTVFAGSANCSVAALRLNGARGNAELITKQEVTVDEFNSLFLGEFDFVDRPPELPSEEDLDDQATDPPSAIRLTGARFDAGELVVVYRTIPDVLVSQCMVDGDSLDIHINDDNQIVIRLVSSPKQVVVVGTLNGEALFSNPQWVDDEEQLRSTAGGRNVVDSLRRSQRSGGWYLEDWSMIVGLLVKDMNYVSPRAMIRSARTKDGDASDVATTFSHNDVFSSQYDSPPSASKSLIMGASGASFSIQNLLLGIFGVDVRKDVDDEIQKDEDDRKLTESRNGSDNWEGDIVDVPEELGPKKVKGKTEKELTKLDRKRVSQLIETVTETITSSSYLELRDPRRLGIDLQVIALLFRKAFSKGWISNEEFFLFTQKVWAELFFNPKVAEGSGALECRYLQSDTPGQFIEDISSPELSAALFAWADAMPTDEIGPYFGRFLATQYLSMGRMQWLWHHAENESEVCSQLINICNDSPCGRPSIDVGDKGMHQRRIGSLRAGQSFYRLQSVLGAHSMNYLQGLVAGSPVERGEMLWQGSTGICIVLDSPAEGHDRVSVLPLSKPDGISVFMRDYLVPIRALLAAGIMSGDTQFGCDQEKALIELMVEVSRASGVGCTVDTL